MGAFGPGLGLGLRQRTDRFDVGLLFGAGEAGAWYDLSDHNMLFQDSGGTIPAAVGFPVGLLRDKSGRGNDAVQPSGGARPTLRQGTAGRHYLSFDGAEDYLTVALAQPLAQPSTIILVGRKSSLGAQSFIDGSTETGRHMAGSRNGDWSLLAGEAAAASSGVAEAVAVVVLTATFDGAASSLRVNGAGGQPIDPGGDDATGLTIGRSPGASPCFLDGRIYELLVVGRRLTASETGAAEAWFAQQYGVQL